MADDGRAAAGGLPRAYWLAGLVLAMLVTALLSRDMTRPFNGLHSWAEADGAWYARAHVKYGLGYTKGVMTQALGDPPPENPRRYFDHPQLNVLIGAGGMWLMGVNEWSLRVLRIAWAVLSVFVLLRILWSLVGPLTAILACVFWVLFPITGYFGTGGLAFLAGLMATWWYLVLVGEIRDGPSPGRRHLAGLAAVLFLMMQLNWTCFFYAAAIGAHYAARCARRREWPKAPLLAVLGLAPLAGAAVTFAVMLAGMEWDVQRIVDLYRWRAARGEMDAHMAEFDWGAWLARFWEFAVTNFTWPVMALGAVGVVVSASRRAGLALRVRRGEALAPQDRGASPQLALFVMPGVMQLLLLRGALWPHQYWERPLGPFIAVGAGLAVVAMWEYLRRIDRPVALAAVGAVMAVATGFCVRGTNHYYRIRWQHPAQIRMWQRLNELILPNEALLMFGPGLSGDYLVTQSKAKGEVIRAEPAWYIDREIAGADTPAEIEAKRQTGRFPVYLVPASYPDPAVDARVKALNAVLERRYRVLAEVPAMCGEVDGEGRVICPEMLPHVIYDLQSNATGSGGAAGR